MARPYRAQLGGIAGSGTYQTPGSQLPIDKILEAISTGASTLIQNAYIRKLALIRLQLERQQISETSALRREQMAATEAYRRAELELRRQSLGAPAAKEKAGQQTAFNSLRKEFPDNVYVAGEGGQPGEFQEGVDYAGALKIERARKSATDRESQSYQDRLALLEKGAQLRDWENSRQAKRTTGKSTPAQAEKEKKEFLTQLGTLSGGDPAQATKILQANPDMAKVASSLGVHDYEIQAAVKSVGDKQQSANSAAAGRIFSSGMAATPEEAAGLVPRLKVPAAPAPAPTGAAPAGGPPKLNVPAPSAAATPSGMAPAPRVPTLETPGPGTSSAPVAPAGAAVRGLPAPLPTTPAAAGGAPAASAPASSGYDVPPSDTAAWGRIQRVVQGIQAKKATPEHVLATPTLSDPEKYQVLKALDRLDLWKPPAPPPAPGGGGEPTSLIPPGEMY